MLDSLDQYARIKLQHIPTGSRYLVTPHDAFAYFCKAYGLKVKSLQGISTVAEYGIRDVSSLISFLSENSIPAMFIESSISPKATEAIVSGCKAKGHPLAIGGQLFSDALGTRGTPEESYEGVFKHNVNTIYDGLTLNVKKL